MVIRRTTPCALLASVLFLTAWANDGADRHGSARPSELEHFPEAASSEAGYLFLPKDMEGGADGRTEFRWARRACVAAVRVAAYETLRALGKAEVPMAIFDLSAENGDTPIEWAGAGPGRGRHPGSSHDGGLNLDLGYYLTSLRGASFSPDYAACTDHFDKGREGKVEDAWICRGPADRLDSERQTRFLLELVRLHAEEFSLGLIEQIGIDRQVRDSVLRTAASWAKEKRHGATPELLSEMAALFTCDRGDGWASSHHHHLHLRFRESDSAGPFREPLDRLLAREREVDAALAGAAGPVLRARLFSSRLYRSVEAELLGAASLRGVRFKLDDGEWLDPDPCHAEFRASFELPRKFPAEVTPLKITAEFTDQHGTFQALATAIASPPLDPRLAISPAVQSFKGDIRKTPEGCSASLTYPEPYDHYVTRVAYLCHRKGSLEKPAERVEAPSPRGEVLLLEGEGEKAVRLVEAEVTLSGRVKIIVPVYCNP